MYNRFSINFLISFCLLVFVGFESNAQSVGLVFSGGGARGLAHVGALKALEENNIPIDYIAGSSMGALIGSMYAIGMSPFEIEQIVTDKSFHDWANGVIDKNLEYKFHDWEPDASWITINVAYDSIVRTRIPKSIVNPAPIDFAMMQYMSSPIAKAGYNFDSLFVPFRAVASDIVSKQPVIFDSGDLALAVRASMAFPFLYSPVHINDMILFDGGIYNNFPADIMQLEFEPDLIIGINTGTREEEPKDNDLLSQIRSMLVQSTCYCVPGLNDLIIEPNIKSYEIFNFENAQSIIDSGYTATLREIESIRKTVNRKSNFNKLQDERVAFIKDQGPIKVDKIIVTGLNINQQQYIRKSIKPDSKPSDIGKFKKNYFRLNADENVRDMNTQLVYNDSTGYYDAHIFVKRENDLKVSFGGNFSSRPISEAFIGFRYNALNKNSIQLNANSYFGKLYTSGLAELRLTIPGKTPLQIEPSFIFNRWDYFKSSSTFFEDLKPSFLVQDDLSAKLSFAIPASNKSKLKIGGGYFKIKDEYYQTRDFLQSDTTDVSKFDGFTSSLSYYRNTLNKKLYASKGTSLLMSLRFVNGKENTIPGSTSSNRDTTNEYHDWIKFKMGYENYFTKIGPITFGLNSELVLSNQPFFSTFTSSILSAPSYHPIQQIKTLFINEFRAHNYAAGGLRAIITPKKNFDIRFEGYVFQPFEAIIRSTNSNKADYGEEFADRFYIGSFNTIYNSPVGPMSISLNYYDQKEDPFEVLFHFGYLIYNRSALD